MPEPVIKIDNLSKQYRLGLVGTGTLSHDLRRWWYLVRGKEDPYLKIGDVNDRSTKGTSDYIWALKDINFEVQQGDVLGIIGKNGAGKSTLLKILSKVTAPTTGSITYKGRIASLLEVGTGFHPELTGRENIYVNGAILGMRKSEITRKFDEIVDFSGCERYIDTPVKRFSSGMTVRLGFAVAAFLEPEILVVDEVLAVGDAEFQKKAIGKMQDVSHNDGRTVLFVSHNMPAIETLCNKAVVLKNGTIHYSGYSKESINFYLKGEIKGNILEKMWNRKNDNPGNEEIQVDSLRVVFDGDLINVASSLKVECTFTSLLTQNNVNLSLHIFSDKEDLIFAHPSKIFNLEMKKYQVTFFIPSNLLNSESYRLSMLFVKQYKELFWINNALAFDVQDIKRESEWYGKWSGYVRPKIDSILEQIV